MNSTSSVDVTAVEEDNSPDLVYFWAVVVVVCCSLFGNTATATLVLSVKNLRTIPNLLIVKLALIDLTSSLVFHSSNAYRYNNCAMKYTP